MVRLISRGYVHLYHDRNEQYSITRWLIINEILFTKSNYIIIHIRTHYK